MSVLQEKYSNAFIGAGPETDHFALELTYNYGVDHYDIGTGFGHFALAHPDVYSLVDSIKKEGGHSGRFCVLKPLLLAVCAWNIKHALITLSLHADLHASSLITAWHRTTIGDSPDCVHA